jgi:PHD/YefM family antitoxin component YafN of YafNO toxin-antitoxin module
MIKTQIIEEDNKPVAVIIDYDEYMHLKELEEEFEDYKTAIEVRQTSSEWVKHKDLKKELGL